MNKIFVYLKNQLSIPHTIPASAAGILLLVIGLGMGISDNPPAIFLVYLGLVLLAFSMIHHWNTPGQYGTLFAVSVISFPVLVLIHNIFETLNANLGAIPVLSQLFSGISIIAFVGAVLIIPAVAAVAMVLGLYHFVKSKF